MRVVLADIDAIHAAVAHGVTERTRAAAFTITATFLALVCDAYPGAVAIVLALDALAIGRAGAFTWAVTVLDAGVAGVVGRIASGEARRTIAVVEAGDTFVVRCIADLPVGAIAIDSAAPTGTGRNLAHPRVAMLVGSAGYTAVVRAVAPQLTGAIVVFNAGRTGTLGAADAACTIAIIEAIDTDAGFGMTAPRPAFGVQQALHAYASRL